MNARSALTPKTDVLLVGSLPYATAEEAFRAAGSTLRGHLGWLPDGEFGPGSARPRRGRRAVVGVAAVASSRRRARISQPDAQERITHDGTRHAGGAPDR